MIKFQRESNWRIVQCRYLSWTPVLFGRLQDLDVEDLCLLQQQRQSLHIVLLLGCGSLGNLLQRPQWQRLFLLSIKHVACPTAVDAKVEFRSSCQYEQCHHSKHTILYPGPMVFQTVAAERGTCFHRPRHSLRTTSHLQCSLESHPTASSKYSRPGQYRATRITSRWRSSLHPPRIRQKERSKPGRTSSLDLFRRGRLAGLGIHFVDE